MEKAFEEVQSALELTAETLQKLVEKVREEGARAFQRRDDRTFERLKVLSNQLENFQNRFLLLRNEWKTVIRVDRKSTTSAKNTSSEATSPISSQSIKRPRAQRGELLPEWEYVFPILQALKNAGGKAPLQAVQKFVWEEVKDKLKPKDFEELEAGPRWINRMCWVRYDLMVARLIAPVKEIGVWEITPLGLSELEKGDLASTWRLIQDAKRRRGRGEF